MGRPGPWPRPPEVPLAATSSTAGDEGDNHVSRVAVEVLSAAVVDRGRPRIGVASRELDIAQRNTRVKRRHDERGPEHVWMDSAEPGVLTDGADPTMSGPSVTALAVSSAQKKKKKKKKKKKGSGRYNSMCGRVAANTARLLSEAHCRPRVGGWPSMTSRYWSWLGPPCCGGPANSDPSTGDWGCCEGHSWRGRGGAFMSGAGFSRGGPLFR